MTRGVASFRRLFRDPGRRDERLDAIALEARERGVDPFDLEAFTGLAETRSALRELTGAVQEAGHPLAALLFHAFHFRQGGAHVRVTSVDEVRLLIDARPDQGWAPADTPRAEYVRLPGELVRVSGNDDAPPTWLAGFYWVHGAGRLTVLAELSQESADTSLLPLPALPSRMVGLWAREPVREAGGDFTDPSGGTGDQSLHVAMAAEILKLATLSVWASDAGGVDATAGPESEPDAGGGGGADA